MNIIIIAPPVVKDAPPTSWKTAEDRRLDRCFTLGCVLPFWIVLIMLTGLYLYVFYNR